MSSSAQGLLGRRRQPVKLAVALARHSHVAVQTWCEMVSFHLTRGRRKATDQEVIEYANRLTGSRHHKAVVSRLKRKKLFEHLSKTESEILDAFARDLPARTMIEAMDSHLHQWITFMYPEGHPSNISRSTRLYNGVYEARRFSFEQPGSITTSAIALYQREHGAERNASATHSTSEARSPVYRFKEYRIKEIGEQNYQSFSHGFWMYDRRGYRVISSCFDFETGSDIFTATSDKIEQSYVEDYFLDDEPNKNVVRGIHPTIIKHQGNPAATTIELRLVTKQSDDRTWSEEEMSKLVNVGVREEVNTMRAERVENAVCDVYKMVRVERSHKS